MASVPVKKNKQQKLLTKRKKDAKQQISTVECVKTLGYQLLSSRVHSNNLPLLLSVLSPSSKPELVLESIISLQAFFLPLLPEIPSLSSIAKQTETEDPERVYRSWLRASFDEFLNSLIGISVSSKSSEAVMDVALDAIMDFVKQGSQGSFHSSIYHRLIQSIVGSADFADSLLNLLAEKYFNHIDVRYLTYTSLTKLSKGYSSTAIAVYRKHDLQICGEESKSRLELTIRAIYNVLSRIPPLEELDEKDCYETWSQNGLSIKEESMTSSKLLDVEAKHSKSQMSSCHIIKKFKLRFTKAWLSFLKLPLPLDVYKEALATLHHNVIPYLSNPAILCDFLTRSYDIGGVISVMALSGLFILMTRHGLEYPRFYEKLYALLKPSIFLAKHRAVFFELLDTCLKSSYLPAYLAAAFAKTLSRLALSVPPSGDLVIIALINNLLRRHPSINFLIHQEVGHLVNGDTSVEVDESTENAKDCSADLVVNNIKHGTDPFIYKESDPLKSNAMISSLWEIDTLRHHYCPAVSRFVASLENDLTSRAKTSEMSISDFSSGSYATIFGEEVRRRIKQCPVAFYRATPASLFNESDFQGWTFGAQQFGGEDDMCGIIVETNDHNVKRQRV